MLAKKVYPSAYYLISSQISAHIKQPWNILSESKSPSLGENKSWLLIRCCCESGKLSSHVIAFSGLWWLQRMITGFRKSFIQKMRLAVSVVHLNGLQKQSHFWWQKKRENYQCANSIFSPEKGSLCRSKRRVVFAMRMKHDKISSTLHVTRVNWKVTDNQGQQLFNCPV